MKYVSSNLGILSLRPKVLRSSHDTAFNIDKSHFSTGSYAMPEIRHFRSGNFFFSSPTVPPHRKYVTYSSNYQLFHQKCSHAGTTLIKGLSERIIIRTTLSQHRTKFLERPRHPNLFSLDPGVSFSPSSARTLVLYYNSRAVQSPRESGT